MFTRCCERVHDGLGHSTQLTCSVSRAPAFTFLPFVAKVALCLAAAVNQLCFCFSVHTPPPLSTLVAFSVKKK